MSKPRKSNEELCNLLLDNFTQLIDEFSHIYKNDVILQGLTAWFKSYRNEVKNGVRPKDEMMIKFIENVYPYKCQINDRNEDYFKNNADRLFHQQLGYVVSIKNYIFGKDANGRLIINDEQRTTIWQYFCVFIKLMDRYIENNPMAYDKKNV